MNNNHKILIVDDKTINLRFLSNLLTEQGYKVQRAISGQLALNAAIASPPDLILLDILMPEMSGYEVCLRLKASSKTREIPVIFLSALREESEKVKAFELGGVDYITKPFQVEEVLARIKNQLTIQNLSKQLQEQNARLQQEIETGKQTEERLRLLESVVVNANDAVLITEAEPINLPGPRIVYANEGFTRMTGYSPEEVIGKTPRILQGTKTKRTTLDRIRQALKSWQSVRVELINYHKNGSEFWVELEIVPVADETGWFTHWVSVQRDITERKQAEIEMSSAKAALERQIQRVLLLEQITQEIRSSLKPEQIFQTAATQIGKAFRVNRCLIHTYIENPTPRISFVAEYKEPGIESILSLESILSSEVPVIGNPYAQLLLSQDSAIATDNVYTELLLAAASFLCHQIGLKSMLAVRTSYQGKPNGVITVHQYDRFRHWTEDEIELLESVAGQVGIAIAQANLLEQETQQRRELAAQNHALEKAKLSAEAANRAKSQFLSKMSHELRTPLNAILGFTQVMAHDDSLTKEQKEHLGIINRSGEHLLELINDILSMSKIEAAQVTLNENCFDLYRLLDSIEDMLRLKANSKGLQLIFERFLYLPPIYHNRRK